MSDDNQADEDYSEDLVVRHHGELLAVATFQPTKRYVFIVTHIIYYVMEMLIIV